MTNLLETIPSSEAYSGGYVWGLSNRVQAVLSTIVKQRHVDFEIWPMKKQRYMTYVHTYYMYVQVGLESCN